MDGAKDCCDHCNISPCLQLAALEGPDLVGSDRNDGLVEWQEEGEADGDEGVVTEEAAEEEVPATNAAAAQEPAVVEGGLPPAADRQPALDIPQLPQIPNVAENLPEVIPVGDGAPPTQASHSSHAWQGHQS